MIQQKGGATRYLSELVLLNEHFPIKIGGFQMHVIVFDMMNNGCKMYWVVRGFQDKGGILKIMNLVLMV